MTRKEQNKILDAKIESNVNQYKVDRLNAKISAFSSGDLNKYEFLKRIDLNYKPNALDKASFEFSPLGKRFSMGLDKTAQGYQEEGIIKLLKDIRDGLAGNVFIPARPNIMEMTIMGIIIMEAIIMGMIIMETMIMEMMIMETMIMETMIMQMIIIKMMMIKLLKRILLIYHG